MDDKCRCELFNSSLLRNRNARVVRSPSSHQCGLGSIPKSRRIIMWVEIIGALLGFEMSFSGYSGILLSSKTNLRFDVSCSVSPISVAALNTSEALISIIAFLLSLGSMVDTVTWLEDASSTNSDFAENSFYWLYPTHPIWLWFC